MATRRTRLPPKTCISQEDYAVLADQLSTRGWSSSPDIAHILGDNDNLSIINHFLLHLGVFDIINEMPAPFTFFIPDNATFTLESVRLNSLLPSDDEKSFTNIMVNIMKNHIFKGIVDPDILCVMENVDITSINTSSFSVTNKSFHNVPLKVIQWYSGGELREAKIKTPNGIKANNGIIYIVDGILY